jgi:hypothetical protein
MAKARKPTRSHTSRAGRDMHDKNREVQERGCGGTGVDATSQAAKA